MKIIITGSKGSIGSNLVPYLIKKGHEVHESNSDITNFADLRKDFEFFKDADWCVNLAALVNTVTCDNAGRYSFDVNVKGAYNVATLSKEFKVKHCFFSTTAIYEPNVLIKEETIKNPQTLYGFTKYLGEQAVEFVFKKEKENLLVVRPCFIFGGKNDHSIGSKIISTSYNNIPLVIHINPEYEKDYMYVGNFVEAIEALLLKNIHGDFNISYGKPIKFKELVKKVKKLGLKPIIYYIPELDYMKKHCVDNSKLKKAINWKPKITLEEGLKKVLLKIKD